MSVQPPLSTKADGSIFGGRAHYGGRDARASELGGKELSLAYQGSQIAGQMRNV